MQSLKYALGIDNKLLHRWRGWQQQRPQGREVHSARVAGKDQQGPHGATHSIATSNVTLLGHTVESAVRTGSVEAEQYLVDMGNDMESTQKCRCCELSDRLCIGIARFIKKRGCMHYLRQLLLAWHLDCVFGCGRTC